MLLRAGALALVTLCALDCSPARPPEDPRAQLLAILAEPEVRSRGSQLLDFFDRVGPAQIAAVRAAYQASAAYLDPLAVALFAEWWASHEPGQALSWFGQKAIGHREIGMATATRRWARRDPQAALEALEDVPAPHLHEVCFRAAILGWAESEGEGVAPSLLAYLRAMDRGPARQAALDQVVNRMALAQGVEAAIRFAESEPDDDPHYKLTVHRRVVSAIARYDIERASAWAVEKAETEFGDGLMRRVANLWGRRDARAAFAWALSAPPSTQRDEALRDSYHAWLRVDRQAAMAWVRSSQRLDEAQAALRVFILALSVEEPEEALARWLPLLRDEKLRDSTTVRVVGLWLRRNREAARRWLASAKLSKALESRVLAAAAERRQGQARWVGSSDQEVDPGGAADDAEDSPNGDRS